MNNNTHKRKKKNKEKEDFSVDNKVPKQQKMTTKADVTDMSAGIIDIDDTPDVATWNKKVHIKEDAVDIIASRFHDAEKIEMPTTIGIGLRDKKASKKDLVVDPANRKDIEGAIKSGSTLTDEAADLSQ
ncbi:MAG: hypothetical protein ACJ71P_16865 [Nitrososphaeraceae archaeon]|jgi:hypothetical protein